SGWPRGPGRPLAEPRYAARRGGRAAGNGVVLPPHGLAGAVWALAGPFAALDGRHSVFLWRWRHARLSVPQVAGAVPGAG
nr:hypothetical protein [Tanacetum cinerariifolium]